MTESAEKEADEPEADDGSDACPETTDPETGFCCWMAA